MLADAYAVLRARLRENSARGALDEHLQFSDLSLSDADIWEAAEMNASISRSFEC
jgi:hypothetical protein